MKRLKVFAVLLLVSAVSIFLVGCSGNGNADDNNEYEIVEATYGILAIFDICHTATPQQINSTKQALAQIFTNRGFVDVEINSKVANVNQQIFIRVLGVTDAEEIFRAIGTPRRLEFRDEQGAIRITASDIQNFQAHQIPQTFEWGVMLTFTQDGGNYFREMIQSAIDYTFIYINQQRFSQIRITDRTTGANNTTFISIGLRADGTPSTRTDAEYFQKQLKMGLLEINLTLIETTIFNGAK